jgi:tetratricopeptide (TPR) repeat protein
LITEGDRRITAGSDLDFFAAFRERQAENSRLSDAYMLKGLGYKGIGKNDMAIESLKKAVEFSNSNLWANSELQTP